MLFRSLRIGIGHPRDSEGAGEVIDYVSQRTESMMALCYLATIYASLRAIDGGRRWEARLFRSDGHIQSLRVETGQPTRDVALLMRLFAERIDALGRHAWAQVPHAAAEIDHPGIDGQRRRHRLLFEWRGRPFVNDHLDAFFNAAVDSGIVLATFVAAADRAGLGSCPVSAIRNHAAEVSDILGLPDHEIGRAHV